MKSWDLRKHRLLVIVGQGSEARQILRMLHTEFEKQREHIPTGVQPFQVVLLNPCVASGKQVEAFARSRNVTLQFIESTYKHSWYQNVDFKLLDAFQDDEDYGRLLELLTGVVKRGQHKTIRYVRGMMGCVDAYNRIVDVLDELSAKTKVYMTPMTFEHSTSYVDPSAAIDGGVIIHPFAYVGLDALVHRDTIISTHATVEHDCVIGEKAFIGPGAMICGKVNIGPLAVIGAGAVVTPGSHVPAGTLVKAGERFHNAK